MGTSTHNSGQKGGTPLVPSWLDEPLDGNNEPQDINPGDNNYQDENVGMPDRFSMPRNEFTRYINSGGRNTSQGRKSVSNYVKNSMGGSSNATKRLGAARSSSARLLSVAGVFAAGGAKAVEQYLSVNNLAGKKACDAFIAITDFICPDGGPADEGIARAAYISAIEDSPEIANVRFEDLSVPQIMLIVERSMVNVILGRIENDIANKVIMLPQDISIANSIISQMKDFIGGAISDAIVKVGVDVGKLEQGKSLKIVDSVYKTAFDIIVSVGETE